MRALALTLWAGGANFPETAALAEAEGVDAYRVIEARGRRGRLFGSAEATTSVLDARRGGGVFRGRLSHRRARRWAAWSEKAPVWPRPRQ